MKRLVIIRPLNLALVVFSQGLIHYGLFFTQNLKLALDTKGFALLALASAAVAAGGNVINDIYDLEIDRVNRPLKVIIGKSLSLNGAYNLYIVLTLLGVGAGFVLAYLVGKPGLAVVFVMVAALLYLYSNQLKGVPILGNALVAALVALSLLVVPLFDLYPLANGIIEPAAISATSVVLHLSVFAFVLNILRELVKDIVDINGDHKGHLRTLPILLGRRSTQMIAFCISILIILMVLIYANTILYRWTSLLIYALLVVVAPLVYLSVRLWYAKDQQDLLFVSVLLKFIMLLGLCSIPLLNKTI